MFLVDDFPVEKPAEVDKQGRVVFKTAALAKGVRRMRAEFIAVGGRQMHNCSSPSLGHMVADRPAIDRNLAAYRLRGLFFEACDCFTICPCWLGANPEGGECTGVFAWEIEKGSIDGTEVSGLRVVSLSHHTGNRDGAKQRVMMFVDEPADRQQFNVLSAAFTGGQGGPLQELSGLLGEMIGVERAKIDLRQEGRLTTLTVGHVVHVEGKTSEGPGGQPMTLGDGKLSQVLGSPATIGESGRFVIGLKEHGMDIELRGRSTMNGRFFYAYSPKPGCLAHLDTAPDNGQLVWRHEWKKVKTPVATPRRSKCDGHPIGFRVHSTRLVIALQFAPAGLEVTPMRTSAPAYLPGR